VFVVILTGFKYLRKISESRNRRIRLFKNIFFSASKNRTTGFRGIWKEPKRKGYQIQRTTGTSGHFKNFKEFPRARFCKRTN